MYLMKYGYMDMHHHSDGKSAPLMSRDGIKKHILEFQKFAGIDQVTFQNIFQSFSDFIWHSMNHF